MSVARRGRMGRAARGLGWGLLLGLCAGGALLNVSCSDPAESADDQAPPFFFSLEAPTPRILVAGSQLLVRGNGLVSQARYRASAHGQVRGEAVSLQFEVQLIDEQRLSLRVDPQVHRALPEGDFEGQLQVEGQLGEASGLQHVPLQLTIAHRLNPTLRSVDTLVFPATPLTLQGSALLDGEEGHSQLELRGQFVREVDGHRQNVELSSEGLRPDQPLDGWAREGGQIHVGLSWFGHQPGQFTGEVRVVNEGLGWRAEGPWQPASLYLLPPAVESLPLSEGSRGQKIPIEGKGFLGGAEGGHTTLRLDGQFTARDGEVVALGPEGLEISPLWLSGEQLTFVMRVRYDALCESSDLGARAGTLEGYITPITSHAGQAVEGERVPILFDILPTKQVVFLRFLPSFTESLRVFGLRNVSAQVRDQIVRVVQRDYQGINVELRLSQPEDFLDYAIVEIGGPDPNEQQLFGLDNTTGIDRCNERLDDLLAGRNADNENSYGGIFVESFLQFSAKYGQRNALNAEVLHDGRTAGETFDDLFEPLIQAPVEAGRFPGGERDKLIEEAIRVLGNLVGNTVSHELGHSLGLPVEPGCGPYHTEAGPRQLMDCGVDRPFSERAELIPGSQAEWNPEDRMYLERILPLY